jgi:hypothetical protein
MRPGAPSASKGPIVVLMTNARNAKARLLTCQGWMGKTCQVTVVGGTLKEAKRQARAEAAGLLPYAGRVTVVRVEELAA